jgi:hypothetical protein
MNNLTKAIKLLLINIGIIKVNPWNDPRRSKQDRQDWLRADPVSLVGKK